MGAFKPVICPGALEVGPRVGGAEQAANNTPNETANTLAKPIRNEILLIFEIMIANLLDEYPMLMFVFEALIALLLLLFIVFWTGNSRK